MKILPSSIYWSGLRTYRILTTDKSPDTLDAVTTLRASEADELTARPTADWDPTLPAAPDGFPDDLVGGLQVQRPEADWLGDRIRAVVPDTLLTHLLVNDGRLDPTSDAPWSDPAAYEAPDDIGRMIEHAELFSLAIHGAALLYNLQIGERYVEAGYTRIDQPIDWYRERYQEWLDDVRDAADSLARWNLDDFWAHWLGRNPRISTRTQLFVSAWITSIIDGARMTDRTTARCARSSGTASVQSNGPSPGSERQVAGGLVGRIGQRPTDLPVAAGSSHGHRHAKGVER